MRASNLRLRRGFAVALGAFAGWMAANYVPTIETPRAYEFGAESSRAPGSAPSPKPLDARAQPVENALPRLLFITFDGVRPDEFFDCSEEENLSTSNCSLPFLESEIRAGRFEAYPMIVGNKRNKSLPGYETIYSGAAQDATCVDNDWCSRVPVETWLERITIDRRLRWWQTAAIASWSKIAIAFEHYPGTIFSNVGPSRMVDPRNGGVPAELAAANAAQAKKKLDPVTKEYEPRWENARLDEFTYAYARWYLRNLSPDVLVMGLLDSDEHGHLDEFSNYKRDLRRYDGYVKTLLGDLKAIGAADNTIVILTTDHGRGAGALGYAFQGHGTGYWVQHSNKTWIAISVPPKLRDRWQALRKDILRSIAKEKRFLDQTDIRTAVTGLMR